MKQLLAILSLAALAACAAQQTGGPRTDWRCDGGAAFSIRFTEGSAEAFAGGQVYTLPQAQSGSGTRYTNGTVEYREHQGQASLNGARGGPYTNCRR